METSINSCKSQHPEFNSFNDLIGQIISSFSSGVSDAERQSRYDSFARHPYKSILYEIFLEMKQSIVLGYPERAEEGPPEETSDPNVDQLLRLDKMLIGKGIISQSESSFCSDNAIYETPVDNPDYLNMVEVLKSIYHTELAKYTQGRDSFCGAVLSLLTDQSHIRPISSDEINSFVDKVQKFFLPIEAQLKQQICEALMVFCSRTLDARRKRRNFNKESTDILNEYFHNNLKNPYPDDETKLALSKKCGISVPQVSNWFGNKRIRFKKSMSKKGSASLFGSTSQPTESPHMLYGYQTDPMSSPQQLNTSFMGDVHYHRPKY